MENIIREQLEKTLNIEANSIDNEDNLIEFGLHSLAIMQLVEIFSQIISKRLKYIDFANAPTIKDWTKILEENNKI